MEGRGGAQHIGSVGLWGQQARSFERSMGAETRHYGCAAPYNQRLPLALFLSESMRAHDHGTVTRDTAPDTIYMYIYIYIFNIYIYI